MREYPKRDRHGSADNRRHRPVLLGDRNGQNRSKQNADTESLGFPRHACLLLFKYAAQVSVQELATRVEAFA